MRCCLLLLFVVDCTSGGVDQLSPGDNGNFSLVCVSGRLANAVLYTSVCVCAIAYKHSPDLGWKFIHCDFQDVVCMLVICLAYHN